MSILITGVAGFIGCNLAAALIARGERILGLDNLSLGSTTHLEPIRTSSAFAFEIVDLADIEAYRHVLRRSHQHEPITEVWHLAANSDIPTGVSDAQRDFRDTFLTTFNTVSLMRDLQIPIIAFASSSAVYGDLGNRLLTEDVGPLFPISHYGAMKLASEATISAALESYLKKAYIFRFPNVIGTPATHGVIFDFIQKLIATPHSLRVLGDGTQQKAYLHVQDLVDAMLFIRAHAPERLNYFNIGPDDEGVTVRCIAEQVISAVAPKAQVSYGQGNKGWIGDVPAFRYSTAKLQTLGWKPKMSSQEALQRAIREIAEQLKDK